MPKRKKYIDTDVLTEARKRIHHILDIHDSAAVCFSGGKDSLATLHLVKEVYEERGLGKVEVIFRDEEFIPSSVTDFVASYRNADWMNLNYFTIPLASSLFVLGKVKDYIQWDENREHIREKPDYAINLKDDEKGLVLDQFTCDAYISNRLGLRGKVAFINGIRASESLIRLRSSVEKINENYINKSSSKNVSMCKPIFDWEENDVFKYFYENDIKYCPIYDGQIWSRQLLRVATPLVSESAKKFYKLKELDPVLYQQCVNAFPEMEVQSRYWNEYQRYSKKQAVENSKSLVTIRNWIAQNIKDPKWLAMAIDEYNSIIVRRKNCPDAYPLDHIYKHFQTGAFKKRLLPIPESQRKK